MKDLIQKHKIDTYFEIAVVFTTKALIVLVCFAVLIVAFVIIGTVLGELAWVIIPPRK